MTENEKYERPTAWIEEDQKVEELVRYLRGLNLERLARDVSDARFSTRILESQRWLDKHEALKAHEEDNQDKLEARLVALQSQLFDKAANYNNIVLTFGYAGFFAIWTFVKDAMHPWDMQLIAMLLGISLLVFISWTLKVALWNVKNNLKLSKVYQDEYEDLEQKLDAILRQEQEIAKRAIKLQRLWGIAFTVSATSGFAAGLSLLFILASGVFDFNFTLHSVKQWIVMLFAG